MLKSITYPEQNTVVIDYDQASGRVKSVNDGGQIDISYDISIPGYDPEDGWNSVHDPSGMIVDMLNVNGMPHKIRSRNDPDPDSVYKIIERNDDNSPNLPTRVVDMDGHAKNYQRS